MSSIESYWLQQQELANIAKTGFYGCGLAGFGLAASKKEKPRLRYLRGQWMQITDRREQYRNRLADYNRYYGD